MNKQLDIPWHRYGLVAHLSGKFHGAFPQFGKTVLQKLIYLLQEGLAVDCGYQYDFYTYGPYAAQLSQDLDFLETAEGINIFPVITGYGGYVIEPGNNNQPLQEKAASFLAEPPVKNGIEKLLQDFSGYYARDLELRATIVYVERELKTGNTSADFENIASTVSNLKPRFTEQEIQTAIEEMKEKKYILLN